MKDVTPRFAELIRDTKAWLEYASECGLTFTSRVSEEVCGGESVPARCETCPLGKESQDVLAPLRGSARIVFVAAAPGPGCRVQGGSPFTGEAGLQLEKIINAARDKAGLGDGDIVLTFARKCFVSPAEEITPELMDSAYRACAPLLREEVEALGPSVVIAMGPEAASALTGTGDILTARGRLHDLMGHANSAIKVAPTYGLEELMGNNKLRRPVWDDILLAIKALGE